MSERYSIQVENDVHNIVFKCVVSAFVRWSIFIVLILAMALLVKLAPKDIPSLTLLTPSMVIPVCEVLLYSVVAKALLDYAVAYEVVCLSKDKIQIVQHKFLNQTTRNYLLPKIKHLHFVGYEKWTPHPFGDVTTDFTGLAEREKMVQAINSEGTMAFGYEGKVVRFGRNIPSWDAAEILQHIQKFYGTSLDVTYSIDTLQ